MSEHTADIEWRRDGRNFDVTYDRNHEWRWSHERCFIANSVRTSITVEPFST